MNLRIAMALALGFALTLPVNGQEFESKDDESDAAIRLESIFVGDKEQPAISYFIPWQGIGAPDQLHWNVEEKHDSALDTVDREIMLRSIRLYGELDLEASAP